MSTQHGPIVSALIERDPGFLDRPRKVRRAIIGNVRRAMRRAGRAEGVTVHVRRARR